MRFIISIIIIIYKFIVFHALWNWMSVYVDFVPELDRIQAGLMYLTLSFGTTYYDLDSIRNSIKRDEANGGKSKEDYTFDLIMSFTIPTLFLSMGYIITLLA